jgi:hypothetical protein
MPGPKMGPRPADFEEDVIRQSPTFIRWNQMETGEKLRYACREFIKGQGDDDERLMRRIMIARRNNLRDHQTLKRARQTISSKGSPSDEEESASNQNQNHKVPKLVEHASPQEPPPQPPPPPQQQQQLQQHLQVLLVETPETTTSRKRRPSTLFSDSEVAKEMDVPAVEATRSYQGWLDLPDGAEFVYNQKYIKGRDGHDWLLRKNIWRRMRYRRENKKMVERMRQVHPPPSIDTRTAANQNNTNNTHAVASQIVDQALLAPPSETNNGTLSSTTSSAEAAAAAARQQERGGRSSSFEVSAAVEAAVAVAESYSKSPYNVVHNPLEGTHHANSAALDAAARIAAAAAENSNTSLDDDAVAAVAAAADADHPNAQHYDNTAAEELKHDNTSLVI